jgi:hypothetical protein
MKSYNAEDIKQRYCGACHVFHDNNAPSLYVQVNISLVEYGYQMDIYVEGLKVASVCNDFGDSFPLPVLRRAVCEWFECEWFEEAIKDFRRQVEKKAEHYARKE